MTSKNHIQKAICGIRWYRIQMRFQESHCPASRTVADWQPAISYQTLQLRSQVHIFLEDPQIITEGKSYTGPGNFCSKSTPLTYTLCSKTIHLEFRCFFGPGACSLIAPCAKFGCFSLFLLACLLFSKPFVILTMSQSLLSADLDLQQCQCWQKSRWCWNQDLVHA